MALIRISILMNIAVATAFIAYDCVDPSIDISRLSLLDVGECHSSGNKLNKTNTHIQVLQKTDYTSVYTYTCKVQVLRTLSHCGMHHHTSLVRNSISDYILEISPDECLKAVNIRAISLFGQTINGLKVNGTTSANIIAAGSITSDGYCKNGVYHESGQTWNDVVAQLYVTITLTTSYSTVEIDNNKLITTTGLNCDLSSTNCIDYELGQVFWSPLADSECSDMKFGTVYAGAVMKAHEYLDDVSTGSVPLVIYSLQTNDISFALSVTRVSKVCGYNLIHTEHSRLFIVETIENGLFPSKHKLDVKNLDLSVYMNTKFVTLHRHIKHQVEDLYRSISLSKCELERRVIRNSLSLAVLSPDEFALNIMSGPGHMAYLAGEVVYMTKCQAREVLVAPQDKCYLEIPVMLQGKLKFCRARSHVLQEYGTEIPCSKILPPMFRINGTWIQLSPSLSRVMTPDMLSPQTTNNWKYESPGSLANSGIYSSEDLDKIRKLMVFPLERQSIVNIMSRQIDGQYISTQGAIMSNLFDTASLEKLRDSITEKLWSGFVSFGTFSAGLFGIYISGKLFKLCLDTILHGIALHGLYGWSLYLFGALWDSMTGFLVALHYKKANCPSNRMTGDVTDMEEGQLNPRESPTAPDVQDNNTTMKPPIFPRLYPRVEGRPMI